MKFIADLHIHSKYSRATAKNLDLENLYFTAQIKGVNLIGTGDFTYPDWIDEIESKLEETEQGLFSLKKEIARDIDKRVPESCRNSVRFILQTEISNIYKKDNRVRKNHNLIYFPDIKSVKKFNAKLNTIGNIKSDGRPILGLDARDLLSIMLEINDKGFFVPAHIWTPWFSMFGSKSGFDSIEECFGSLKDHIFAVETGLSSDPPMNWRVKDLDKIRLISSSDAHSPGYLGRNASVFNTDLSFHAVRGALETNDLEKYNGTLDMYPHQGKYHYDGHRKCSISLNPADTAKVDGVCPECGKKLTCGVLNRVQELAARPEGYIPENRHGFRSIIPLADILSQIFEVGPKTKKVTRYYNKAVEALGPELDILLKRSFDEIERAGIPFLAEAIRKMHTGEISIEPGFDGEFGKVKLFSRKEKEILQGEKYLLFKMPRKKTKKSQIKTDNEKTVNNKQKNSKNENIGQRELHKVTDILKELNPEQQKVVDSNARAVIIQAGPGTGKTRTLTSKIAHLVSKEKTDPGSILALTFTNKAAKQLESRIEKYMPHEETGVLAATFHSFCLMLLKKFKEFDSTVSDDNLRLALIKKSMISNSMGKSGNVKQIKKIDMLISVCKQNLISPEDDFKKNVPEKEMDSFKKIYHGYQSLCMEENVVDFEDLVMMSVNMFFDYPEILSAVREQYQYVFVDEYQDLNFGQYQLIKLICQHNHITVIGDPDQSIYGFRGSDSKYFKKFADDFPGCEKFILYRNYRSTQTILDASSQVIIRNIDTRGTEKIFSSKDKEKKLIVKEAATEYAEAVSIGRMIEKLIGGISFFSIDAGKIDSDNQIEYAFSDFAVLCRTSRQYETFIRVFEKEGIPFQNADKKNIYDTEGIKQCLSLCRIFCKKASFLDLEIAADYFDEDADQQRVEKLCEKKLEPLTRKRNRVSNEQLLMMICEVTGLTAIIEKNDKSRQIFQKILSTAGLYDSMENFLDIFALNQDADTIAVKTQAVSLMTMHAAKGLEFPVVFIAGCEQGLSPFALDGKKVENIEEERRLFYVAMTRAMDILCLTHAKKRVIYGVSHKRERSVFIDDIEKDLTTVVTAPVYIKPVKKAKQMEMFQ